MNRDRLVDGISRSFLDTSRDIVEEDRDFRQAITTRRWYVTTAHLAALVHADLLELRRTGADRAQHAERFVQFMHLTDEDYSDWRYVTFEQATAENPPDFVYENTAEFAAGLRAIGDEGAPPPVGPTGRLLQHDRLPRHLGEQPGQPVPRDGEPGADRRARPDLRGWRWNDAGHARRPRRGPRRRRQCLLRLPRPSRPAAHRVLGVLRLQRSGPRASGRWAVDLCVPRPRGARASHHGRVRRGVGEPPALRDGVDAEGLHVGQLAALRRVRPRVPAHRGAVPARI